MPPICRSLLLIAVFTSIPSVYAQTAPTPSAVDPQKAELVRKILAVDGFDKLAKQVEGQTLARTLTAMAQNPMFPHGFLQELSKRMNERLTEMDVQSMLIPMYAERFSVEELHQILDFESSPTGQKFASAQAAMLLALQPEMTGWNRKTGQEATRQILTDHPEWAKQIAENRQRQSAATLAAAEPGDPAKANEKTYWNSRDVQPPQIVTKSEPQYTEEARRAKLEGSVTISLTVGSDGLPRDVRVVRPLGSGLDEKAVEAVQSWRWKPAMKSGVPVATHATVEVNFRITDKPPVNN